MFRCETENIKNTIVKTDDKDAAIWNTELEVTSTSNTPFEEIPKEVGGTGIQ